MMSQSHGKPSPLKSDANSRELCPNVIIEWLRVHAWREAMIISFLLLSLSLAMLSRRHKSEKFDFFFIFILLSRESDGGANV